MASILEVDDCKAHTFIQVYLSFLSLPQKGSNYSASYYVFLVCEQFFCFCSSNQLQGGVNRMLLEELLTTFYDAPIVRWKFLAAGVSKHMFWLFLHWRILVFPMVAVVVGKDKSM